MGDESEALNDRADETLDLHELFDGKVCNRCGRGGFKWGKYFGKWRLFTMDDNLHTCKKRPNFSQTKVLK